MKDKPRELRIVMAHDEDAEVYLNGVLATKVPGHIGEYQEFEADAEAVNAPTTSMKMIRFMRARLA